MAQLSRRGLLGATAAVGLLGVAACEGGEPAATPPFDPHDWASVRAQFALDPTVAHLSTFVFAPHPAGVRAAIEQHRAGFDRDPIGYLHAHEAQADRRVASAVMNYLGNGSDRVAFTDSTTLGLGLLYGGLRLGAGDEVLTTKHDFYATHEALRLRTLRDGVAVRQIELYSDPATASVDEIVGKLTAAVGPRTRVVAVTWVHSSTGVRLPIRAIADALAGRDVLLCVDGVHGFGAVDATPESLGCDFLVSGCHKWLHGPRGTGLIWGSDRGWSRFAPSVPSFDGRSLVAWLTAGKALTPPGPAATPGGYHSFEHRWALAEAFHLYENIGRDRVAGRVRELATRLKDGLAGIGGVELATPRDPELSAGVICCRIGNLQVDEVVGRLAAAKVVASATPYRTTYVRFGPGIANSEEHIDAALRAVRDLV
ncbi:class V aminotransferase [Asanoa ishikariensis]|uniref:Selenocysteine lyase/Cysteine desulfurase n=1 Tax=Asanoa ishikariensis TaxID=137265 RepID=A0A1H3KDP8_9ACTN|nr:aminotransferase class V-fold PLP-dependent enzyme [Asanoa ishikariensis]GIF70394.1 class V aminotransferase [Asanoa ishikariensis]SDY50236.1 Selenocysteine lyase/Cysteine desulfurase [Asanoa ishikariensis]